MAGQKEDLQLMHNGQVAVINRGNKGAAVVNISQVASLVDTPTGLPNGTYTDKVYGKEFKVKNGRLKGLAAPLRSYILEK